MLSSDALQRIDREVAKYPAEQKQSAVMAALAIAQEETGWLTLRKAKVMKSTIPKITRMMETRALRKASAPRTGPMESKAFKVAPVEVPVAAKS